MSIKSDLISQEAKKPTLAFPLVIGLNLFSIYFTPLRNRSDRIVRASSNAKFFDARTRSFFFLSSFFAIYIVSKTIFRSFLSIYISV